VHQNWSGWHDAYDAPHSPLARRLAIVQDETRQALSRRPAGPIRLVSMCAGQGHDVIGALDGHPRQADVTAVLLELDAQNVALAQEQANAAGLTRVSAIEADASLTDAYAEYVPTDVLLVCGVFGNVSEADIRQIIGQLPHLCGLDATIIWTRHLGVPGRLPDRTPTIRGWFEEAGFRELAFRTVGPVFGVGSHQLVVPPKPYQPGVQLFTWIGQGRG
jgi:hypothetical protein